MVAHPPHHVLVEGFPIVSQRHLHVLVRYCRRDVVRTALQFAHGYLYQLLHDVQRFAVVLLGNHSPYKLHRVLIVCRFEYFVVVCHMVL